MNWFRWDGDFDQTNSFKEGKRRMFENFFKTALEKERLRRRRKRRVEAMKITDLSIHLLELPQ